MIDLPVLKQQLLEHPSKELLTEIINSAELPNPMMKTMLFMAIQALGQADIDKFAKIAVVALQYIEQGNMEGLKDLCQRVGVPAPIAAIVNSYAAHYTRHE